MASFFGRIDGYDDHMLKNNAGADEFYPASAMCLSKEEGPTILDLGCGTGLELQ